jgi:poly(A) polymerase
MADAQSEQYGVTPPFSMDPPSAKDKELNDALNKELRAQNVFAPPEEIELRQRVLEKLGRLLKEMVQLVGQKKGLPDGILATAGGKVFTYGSYKLGVFGPGSDIDTLMVAPKHVTRDDFFECMPDLLRKHAAPGEITKLTPVSGAGISVPIIKLVIQGVEIDLIFSSLNRSSIPDDLELSNEDLLRDLDDTDRRSVNGNRVASRILQLVPEAKTFRLTLRAVKLWASRRAIYGNVYGYPGGVAYAILVARICQLYPMAAAPVLLQKFFWVMKQWNWPKPVFLQHREPSPLGLREWDPVTYRGDAAHLMPILTPSTPTMNAAHTVGPSTKKVLMEEFQRGNDIVAAIYKGQRPWKDLFEKHTFFTETYKHYICVITAGRTQDAAQKFAGRVQSRLKWLVKGIEDSHLNSVELVQPFMKGFDREHECKDQNQIEEVIHGSLDYQVRETKTVEPDQTAEEKSEEVAQTDEDGIKMDGVQDEVKPAEKWPQMIWTTTYYLGIGLKKGMLMQMYPDQTSLRFKGGTNQLDISAPVKNFTTDTLSWEDYDENMHSMKIKHVRKYVDNDCCTQWRMAC